MKKALLHLMLLLPLLVACTPRMSKGIDMIIRNKTGQNIAEVSVCVRPCTGNAVATAIPAGKSTSYFLDMSSHAPKGDGDYEVRYRFVNDSIVHRKYFGYFTNGSPTSHKMELTIFENRVVERSM